MEVSGVSYKVIENPEYLAAWVDAEGKLLAGRTIDGAAFENVGLSSQRISTTEMSINGHSLKDTEDIEGRSEVTTDTEGNIISYRDKNGILHEKVGLETPQIFTNSLNLSDKGMSEFQKALKDSGFNPNSVGNWSDYKSLEIPMPRCAIINITNEGGNALFPQAKGVNYKNILEFWDMAGNYFKKEIIMNAQGNSSMGFSKKNGAFDICNNNGWDDEDTFSLKIGDWVPQDSFHIKAYMTNIFRGEPVVAYHIADKITKSRGFLKDRPWKIGLLGDFESDGSSDGTTYIDDMSLQMDNGARCIPDGFPTIVYLNGEFYGVYSWQLKKSRDNYHLNKKKSKNIHLDGDLYSPKFWVNANEIDWTAFEIRNPKNLVYAEPQNNSFKYDADVAQAEIAGIDKNYDGDWSAGTYAIGRVVKVGKNYFINQVADNTAEPITKDSSGNKNTADSPDFKNKTKCGWINCTLSVEVKQYVQKFSERKVEMDALAVIATPNGNITIAGYQGLYNSTDNFGKGICVSDGSGNYYMSLHTTNTGHALSDTEYWIDVTQNISDIMGYIDTYFDKNTIIDYLLFSQITANYDGFGKNWQLVTYDGIKWFMCYYDLDGVFGDNFTGLWADPPEHTADWNTYILAPAINGYPFIKKLWEFHFDDFIQRYSEIRSIVGVTHDYIISELNEWASAVGQSNYEKEFEKWPDTPCNRDTIINDGWELVPNVYWRRSGPDYDPNHTYAQGEECVVSYRAFRATREITGVIPSTQVGYRDSIFRISAWIKQRFSLLDSYYNQN